MLFVALVAAIVVLVSTAPAVDEELTADQREVAAEAEPRYWPSSTVDHRNMDPLVDAALLRCAMRANSRSSTPTSGRVWSRRPSAPGRPPPVRWSRWASATWMRRYSATVLVAANSDVSNNRTGGEPQTRYYRLRLDLVREGDPRLTNNVQFVR